MTRRVVLVASLLCGCMAYRTGQRLPPADVTQRPGPSTPVFVLVAPSATGRPASGRFDWRGSLGLAYALEKAGFRPALVASTADVPANTPYVEKAAGGHAVSAECDANPVAPFLSFFSLGIFPVFDCFHPGYRFDVHRSGDSPARRIDTVESVPYVFGWLALPLTLLPQYSSRPDVTDDEERRRLRNALLDALEGEP